MGKGCSRSTIKNTIRESSRVVKKQIYNDMTLGMIKFGTILLILILLVIALSVNCSLKNDKEKEKNKTICTSCQKKEQHATKPLGDDGSARQEKSSK